MSLIQVYNPEEAQQLIINLKDRFKYLEKKSKAYRIYYNIPPNSPEIDLEEIVSIQTFSYQEEYVYDLATENNHFQSGVGIVCVHNTDSVMVSYPKEQWTDEEAFENANELADEITEALFSPPCVLEFEKIYFMYLLLNKKRYAGMKKEFLNDTLAMDIKGLEPVRRENSPFITDFLVKSLNFILIENTPFEIYNELKTYLEMTLNGEIPVEKFIMTTSLKAESSYKQITPQRRLASKINLESGYEKFASGDRMPFAHVVPYFLQKAKQEAGQQRLSKKKFYISTKGIKQENNKIEHVETIIKLGLTIDYEYYIDALFGKLENLIQFNAIRFEVKRLFEQKLKLFLPVDVKIAKKVNKKRKLLTEESNLKKKAPFTMENFFKKK